MKKIIRPIALHLALFYFRVRSSWPVWFYFLNWKNRKKYRMDRLVLDGTQKRVVLDLLRSGIATVSIEDLLGEKETFAALLSYTNELMRQAATKTNKKFLKYLWEVAPVMDFKNPFVAFALNQKVVDVINSYMRMWSVFYSLSLNVTTPVGPEAKEEASQRWHRDPEDKRMIKMFLYLSDVDEEAGPFTYIPGSAYGMPFGSLFPQRPPKGFYPPDGAVERIIQMDKYKVMTGRAGTLIFCDTSGLHKGGYALSKDRVMFTAAYRSSASPWVSRFSYAPDFKLEIERRGLSASARYMIRAHDVDRLTTSLIRLIKGSSSQMMA